MTAAAFKASYSDWKLIKTRSVVQIVFEVPLEAADEAYQVLDGMPDFGSEQWFAIAKLSPEAKEREPVQESNPPVRARKPWDELPPPQQAAIRCNDPAFQNFLREEYRARWKILSGTDAENAAELVRVLCKVTSRSHIGSDSHARNAWHEIDEAFRAWMHPL